MTTTPQTLHLTARCPEDLLAMAPVVLGFWPHDSVVMMTFGARRAFHARLPLPDPAELDAGLLLQVEESLLGPAEHHGVQAVVLLYYSDDPHVAGAVHRALVAGCRARGIGLVTAIAADGAEFALLDLDGEPGPRTPYDVTAHPFVVQGIVAGRTTHPSREHMVDSIQVDEAAAVPVLAALGDGGWLDTDPPSGARAVRRHGNWVVATVRRAVDTGELLAPAEVARLLWALQVPRIRDAAWSVLEHRTAVEHVRFWTQVLRRTPDQLAAAPAVLLGLAAWQSGDGALAWAAVDRCRRADPHCRLADLLAGLLEGAVAPEDGGWEVDWTLGLPPEATSAH
ncbi:MAG TPA: DUF4192 domain-containing protein [Nocardioides sp.]|nr:DUF4192 domain-containing protein [Nocardioides sp.]